MNVREYPGLQEYHQPRSERCDCRIHPAPVLNAVGPCLVPAPSLPCDLTFQRADLCEGLSLAYQQQREPQEVPRGG
jgi:hypothetical protein